VIVGDDDLGPFQVGEHLARCELAAWVVAVRVVRLQHAQAVADGQTGGDDQEAPRKAPALGPAYRIDGLPGGEHGHDGVLAGPGGELEGQTHQSWVGLVIGVLQVLEITLAEVSQVRCDFGKPKGSLDRLDLAEEGAYVAESVVTPVAEQLLGLRGYAPLRRVRQSPPLADLPAHTVDDRSVVVLLLLGREPLSFVVCQTALVWIPSSLLRPGYRCDELGGPSIFDDPLGGLPLLVELPMPRGILVWRVEYRLLEESVVHRPLLHDYPLHFIIFSDCNTSGRGTLGSDNRVEALSFGNEIAGAPWARRL
jgi:hypothetical protein